MVKLQNTRTFLLHLNASDETFTRSSELRKSMTNAERVLWNQLKNKKLDGLKFRRQHPIHYYIADFYCHELRLVIEVDGGIHHQKPVNDHDQNRSAELDRFGITVLRFTNDQIETDIETVLAEIIKFADSRKNNSITPQPPTLQADAPHPPAPSPEGEGERVVE